MYCLAGSDNGVHLTMAAGNASHVSVHPPEPLEEATVHHTLFKPSQERAIYVGATPGTDAAMFML